MGFFVDLRPVHWRPAGDANARPIGYSDTQPERDAQRESDRNGGTRDVNARAVSERDGHAGNRSDGDRHATAGHGYGHRHGHTYGKSGCYYRPRLADAHAAANRDCSDSANRHVVSDAGSRNAGVEVIIEPGLVPAG